MLSKFPIWSELAHRGLTVPQVLRQGFWGKVGSEGLEAGGSLPWQLAGLSSTFTPFGLGPSKFTAVTATLTASSQLTIAAHHHARPPHPMRWVLLVTSVHEELPQHHDFFLQPFKLYFYFLLCCCC